MTTPADGRDEAREHGRASDVREQLREIERDVLERTERLDEAFQAASAAIRTEAMRHQDADSVN